MPSCGADARDVVLIAGKGHEDYQEIGGVKLPFSDASTPPPRSRARARRTRARQLIVDRAPTMMTLARCRALLPGARLVGAPTTSSRASTATRAASRRATCSSRCAASASTPTISWPQAAPPARSPRSPSAASTKRACRPGGRRQLRALGDLAARWRRRFELPLIAVTGSNGKTTVTQMIAASFAPGSATRRSPPRATSTTTSACR